MGNTTWLGAVLLTVCCGGCAVESRENAQPSEETGHVASKLDDSDYGSPSLVPTTDPSGTSTSNYIANWVQVDGASAPVPQAPPPRRVEGLQPSYALDNGSAAVVLYGYDP